jgi:hypothetical protein
VLVTIQIVVDLLLVGVITKVLLGAAQLQNRRLRASDMNAKGPSGDEQEPLA